MSRIYAIGDVHGCANELQRLLALIHEHAAAAGIEKPRLVLLGDYVDRGPDSKGVLDLLIGPTMTAFDPVYLCGNHDLALLNILRGAMPSSDWMEDQGGWQTLNSYGDFRARNLDLTIRKFRAAVPDAHKTFLGDLSLFSRQDDWFFCHAGINADVPLGDQFHGSMIFGDYRWIRRISNPQATGLRQRLGARVVHGHWTTREVEILPHRIGVDTGAGLATGKLSAVVLENGQVEVLS
jgi:serine/threonine protein phosphatase 1